MTLLIDNYDSFSYNLFQYVGELDPDIRVIRNDEMNLEEIRALKPDRIILSPGPGRPEDAGITQAAAGELGKEIPLDEIKKLLAGQKTSLIKGFRSNKTHRLFDAYLTLVKGKLKFEFPPREFKPRRFVKKKSEE